MGSLATAPISCITPLYVRADSIAEFSGVTVWNLWYQTSGLDYCLNDDVVDDDFCEKDFYIF